MMISDLKNTQSKKELFIFDTLLPYCLQCIETAKDDTAAVNLQKQVATMEIFPYITEDKIVYGALKDGDISWYFTGDKDKIKPKSTESYRILNRSQIKPDLFKRLRHVFGVDGCGYIHEFSDQVVIEDLVRQMSSEYDYTDKWWKCASDAFALWNTASNPGSSYEKASENIKTSYMLYDDEYCDLEHQILLERYHIMNDIRKTIGYKHFIENIEENKKTDGIRFLKYLGIRSSFLRRIEWGRTSLCRELEQMFSSLGKYVFPVAQSNLNCYEQCKVSEYIFFKVLVNEDISFAKELLKNDNCNIGITILNVNNEFMPLSCSMFYLPQNFVAEDLVGNRLNMFLVKSEIYNEVELNVATIPIDSIAGIETFSFGNISVKNMPFYRWAWQFTHNIRLVDSILKYFNSLSRIEANIQDFALTVLQEAVNKTSVRYTFRMNVLPLTALEYNTTINSIYRDETSNITFWVQDKISRESLEIKYRILQAVENQVTPSIAKEIESADFWDHIYIVDNPNLQADSFGKYVIVQYNDQKQNYNGLIILLGREEDTNSYIEAICDYIIETYGVSLTGVTSDLKSEYYRLAHGIDEFICDHSKAIYSSEKEIMFNESEMADVDNHAHECSIWKRFQNEKKDIFHNRISKVDLNSWRDFLNNKYHGRCQLCGNKTVSGTQNAFFWTYRIIKDSQNDLANMHSNIFCLCPTCHGELSHGFLGKDLTQIKKLAMEYVEQLEDCLHEKLDNPEEEDSVIESFADKKNEYPGFHAPIICNVTVNGTERKMAFSWEHFMRIAFLLSCVNDEFK